MLVDKKHNYKTFFNIFNSHGFTLIESMVAIALFVLTMTSALGLYLTYSQSQKETGLRQETLNQLSFEIEKIAQDIRLKTLLSSSPVSTAGYKTGNLYEADSADDGGVAGIVGKEYELGFLDGTIREVYFFQKNAPSSIVCTGTVAQGRFYKYTSVGNVCEPIFSIAGVTVTDVAFYIAPSYKAYPKATTDCKTTSPSSFEYNGYYCTCKQDSDCFSNNCSQDDAASSVATGFCYTAQPNVTIAVTAQVGSTAANTIVIQTTVSSRDYN